MITHVKQVDAIVPTPQKAVKFREVPKDSPRSQWHCGAVKSGTRAPCLKRWGHKVDATGNWTKNSRQTVYLPRISNLKSKHSFQTPPEPKPVKDG